MQALPTHRSILALALPIMLSNLSTPLLGLVDTAIIGRLPDASYIGAVAVGSLILTFVYWGFGFLRMGTTGLTAQALGKQDGPEISALLARSLLISGTLGLAIILLRAPIEELAFTLLEAAADVESSGRTYVGIRIWSAPATLANYAILGWLVGLGKTRAALAIQLVLNVTNMLLDALLVLHLNWQTDGVATGTLVAEWLACAIGLAVARRHLPKTQSKWSLSQLLAREKLIRMLSVNSDIMIRSLSLIGVFAWFTAQGAKHGTIILAANAILSQLISFAAFFLDGAAFAAEALIGKAIGAGNRAAFWATLRKSTEIAAALALLLSLGFFALGPTIINLLTVVPDAQAAARTYLPWAAGIPILGVWCFQLDGIFIGATCAAEMRNAMLASLAIFALAWWLFLPWANHGLWAAFYVHYLARTTTLLAYFRVLLRKSFTEATA